MVQELDKATDFNEVISQPGGFMDNEDSHSVAADREDIIGLKKSTSRSATVWITLWIRPISCVHAAHIYMPPQGMVSITHSAHPPKQKVVDARKIGNILPPYKEKFDTDFVPSVIECISQSDEPWNNPDGKVPLQKVHDKVYHTIDGVIDRQHPLVEPVSHFITPIRNSHL